MSAQDYSPANAYRRQDGQIVKPGHPDEQWADRCPVETFEDENLRAIWRVSHPIDFLPAAGAAYARFHPPTGMVLIASWGFVQTAVHIDSYSDDVRRHVSRQLPETTL